jgi:hypothetical protein
MAPTCGLGIDEIPRSPPVTATHSCKIFQITQPNAIVTMAR